MAVYGNIKPEAVKDAVDLYLVEQITQRACRGCGIEVRAEYGRNEEGVYGRWCKVKTVRLLGKGGLQDGPV